MARELKIYKTATDFRCALEARVRQTWKQCGGKYQDHTRSIAFERFLARCNPNTTTVKGGYALELRMPEARTTRDIDLNLSEKSLLLVEKEKRAEAIRQYFENCLNSDLGDHFKWKVLIGAKELPNAEGGGTRLTIISEVDNRIFREFHVDVNLQDIEILPPEKCTGHNMLGFASIPNPIYSVTPNEAIFAEKLQAYTTVWRDRENSRVKDIIDMNLIIDQKPNSHKLCLALNKVFKSHKLPEHLSPPPESWNKDYPRLAQLSKLSLSLDQAYERLNSFYEKLRKNMHKYH